MRVLFLIFALYLEFSVTSSNVLYVGRDATHITYDLLFCGTSKLSKVFVNLLLQKETAEQVSHCCSQHDDCYNNQQNQENCDRIFKYCVQIQEGAIVAQSYYGVVRVGGVGPYGESYVGSGPDYSFTDSTLHNEFVAVRKECLYNRNALSSSVIQYELCKNRGESDCKMRLAVNLWRLPAAYNGPCFDTIRKFIKGGLQIFDIWEQSHHVGTP
ncbi:unnamed protein product [Caenorhabditis angaria]|uniref:Uncharacterized protein n=1 Tax=Caenorhabditis angaria TaxID=860376 RepID=A0A9P1N7U4_9PELO|nr:unnamed protein product [Caenorhabditis angaria]